MTIFYFRVEMTKASGRYWTVGLNLNAETYNEALRLFRAWAFGVEAMGYITPHLRSLSDKPTPNRSYFNMDSGKAILAELTTFMDEKGIHNSDDDSMIGPDMVATDPDDGPDDWSHDPNDNCPF